MAIVIGAMQVAAVEPVDLGSYTILFLGVAASWIGVPIVGGAALAAAGALAADGQLDIWLVIVVAAVASWTGGYVGYLLGHRARGVFAREGRWQRQRRHAMRLGERFYRRWGPVAVFLTPTWVSGALRMPRNSFLAWNAIAAVASSLVTVFGAYATFSAVLGRLSAGHGLALLAAVITAVALGVALWRRRSRFKQDDPPAGRPCC